MNAPEGPAAPASGSFDHIPDFAALAADPEVAALLDFDPVPMRKRVNGWDSEAQRAFIILLATTGSKLHAATAIGRNPAGIDRILEREDAAGFRLAFDRAMALAAKKNGAFLARGVAAARKADPDVQAPGQILNEYGEYEDEGSFQRRGEEAMDSIAGRLLRIRRLYLQEIAASPGNRAAFEILTELPVDWDKAARLEPQDDEPYRTSNQRQPDMVLMAESGWSFGEMGYGPNRLAAARQVIDDERAKEGLEPVDWSESTASNSSPPLDGEGQGVG